MFVRIGYSVCILLALAANAQAQDWAKKLFPVTSHDFGTVPRAARSEYDFVIVNTLNRPIRVTGVRASCGCTTPTVTREIIPPGEKGAIHAVFNTRNFIGDRSATLTVTISEPQYAEIQLKIVGYVRRDVVLDPSQVDFGSVRLGKDASQVVKINYAGRSDWKLTKVNTHSEFVKAELIETRRAGGAVSYDLKVDLAPNAPVGNFSLPVNIETNDARLDKLQLMVEGRVVSPVTISPESLSLGSLKPGAKVEKKLIVRGDREFNITGYKSSNSALTLDLPNEAKKMHMITAHFEAGKTPERVAIEVTIDTDLDGVKASFKAYATIEPDPAAVATVESVSSN